MLAHKAITHVRRQAQTNRLGRSHIALSQEQWQSGRGVLVCWFDPGGAPVIASTGTFTVTGSMTAARAFQAAVLPLSLKVLEATGFGTATAELYDPSSETFAYTATLNVEHHQGQATLLLNDGVVLVTGGEKSTLYRPRLLNSAEIYH
jgi:hypothetical protein